MFIKMVEENKRPEKEKKIYEEIEIPLEISASIEGDTLIMKKDDKEIKRNLSPFVKVNIEEGKIILSVENRIRKKEKKMFGTLKAHIKNMIKGLIEGFVYKLQVANVHFPMTVSYDKENNEIVVKNFLGEKKERRIKLIEGVEVKVNKDIIEVMSHDIEKAGNMATQIERLTSVKKRDRRIFQDGIFIISKPGKDYL